MTNEENDNSIQINYGRDRYSCPYIELHRGRRAISSTHGGRITVEIQRLFRITYTKLSILPAVTPDLRVAYFGPFCIEWGKKP
jgi:hypothetical protein